MTRARTGSIMLVVLAAAGVAAGDDAARGGASGAGGGPAALEALVKAAPACEAARAHCVGIRLHVAAADGGLVATPDFVARQVAAANAHLAAVDLAIQVVGADALPEAAARIANAGERSALARRVAGTVIDVFMTARLDDIDVAGGEIRGVAWPAGAKKYVILSTIAPDRTLAHELGHVLGLPHSSYAISIMNKAPREQPPIDQRTFHPDEIAAMRWQLARLLRERVIADLPRPAPPPP